MKTKQIKQIDMSWSKYKKEPFGTLQIFLKSGAIKTFCENTKKEALKQGKQWLEINKISGWKIFKILY